MNNTDRRDDGTFLPTHGLSKHPLYHVWLNMKSRCSNPNNHKFELYGKRGITVCKEWASSFMAFYTWATANGYEKGLSLDRIDNNEGYCPENCRFATAEQQNQNRRVNRTITYKGKTQCLAAWGREIGIDEITIARRLDKGLPVQDVLSPKKRTKPCRIMLTYKGRTQSVIDWAKETGLSGKLIYKRLSKGYSVERVLEVDPAW
ncbi:MAG: hypothetical protein II008_11615 [Oscillospiraceae bacterium]|jgi:hypothetical protein|nr:hypothetical protein [Oscillospiraceae bacterium]